MALSNGVDTPDTVTVSDAEKLFTSGVKFVSRYYSSSSWKALTPTETIEICAAGLFIVSVVENNPIFDGYFTAEQGMADGRLAVEQAKLNGQPEGTPIFLTVDEDTKAMDVVLAYATAAHKVIKDAGYDVGWYGSGLVLQTLLDAGYGSYWWLSESTGWQGYQAFYRSRKWNICQLLETSRFGLDVDTDMANRGGGWKTMLKAV